MSETFVTIDFETANSFRGSPCSVGLTRVTDGEVVETYQKLMLPPAGFDHFDVRNIAVHGINEKDVAGLPRFGDFWPEIEGFIDNKPVVAHNAGFDLSVLRSALTYSDLAWPELDYFCTLVMSRRALSLVSYSLPFVADELGVALSNHHDALSDAYAVAGITLGLMRLKNVDSLSGLAKTLRVSTGHMGGDGWRGSKARRIVHSNSLGKSQIDFLKAQLQDSIASEGPLVGKQVAFTGAMSAMTRSEAFELVILAGGIPQETVNRQTDFLVFGMQDARHLKPGASVSAKYEKAQKLRAGGSLIEVIDEEMFLGMIE